MWSIPAWSMKKFSMKISFFMIVVYMPIVILFNWVDGLNSSEKSQKIE